MFNWASRNAGPFIFIVMDINKDIKFVYNTKIKNDETPLIELLCDIAIKYILKTKELTGNKISCPKCNSVHLYPYRNFLCCYTCGEIIQSK